MDKLIPTLIHLTVQQRKEFKKLKSEGVSMGGLIRNLIDKHFKLKG